MARTSLRLLAASLATLLYGSCAVAQTRYEFFLDHAIVGVAGSGFFTVDDSSIPLLGSASVRATSFEGTLGRPFGYSQGNTETTITFDYGPPPHEVVDVVRSPTNAVISFQDHSPVAIGYDEIHSVVEYNPACGGGCFSFQAVTMIGTEWFLSERHGFDSGAIRFASPIPESATVLLLLSGLGLVTSVARRRRCGRTTSGSRPPYGHLPNCWAR